MDPLFDTPTQKWIAKRGARKRFSYDILPTDLICAKPAMLMRGKTYLNRIFEKSLFPLALCSFFNSAHQHTKMEKSSRLLFCATLTMPYSPSVAFAVNVGDEEGGGLG